MRIKVSAKATGGTAPGSCLACNARGPGGWRPWRRARQGWRCV